MEAVAQTGGLSGATKTIFRIDSVATGQDSLGEASVVLDVAGQSAAPVKGVSIDIIEAAALAHLRAVNAER